MVTVIYVKPYYIEDGLWLIGWSKTQFEKCKANIHFKGTYEQAQEKIDSFNCKKYIRKAA